MKYFWITIALLNFLIAEPSVYGHRYSSSSNNTIIALKQQIASMQEEIEGLKSILNGLLAQVERLKREKNKTSSNQEIEALKYRIEQLEQNSQNKNYTTSQTSTKTKAKQTNSLSSANSAKMYSKAVRLYSKKRYTEAKKRFEILLQRGYKRASSNFYLGEISYYTKNYKDAIKYYHDSATLKDNASYMDTLLLHTAISLYKTGSKKEAKGFFQAIVDGYPKTYSAKIAKKYLKK